jgi:hypothetical protein
MAGEPASPNPDAVYKHSPDIVAMPVTTFNEYEALIIALRGQAHALTACYQAAGGDIQEWWP